MTVRQLRQRCGLSQQTVAEIIGCKQRTISQWERLLLIPNLADAVLLARCYNVTLDEIAMAFGLL